MKFGAIDIGTNAARLLIGEVVEDSGIYSVKKISYTRIPLRLGIEVFENGFISEKKATEFKKSILAFKLISEVFEVTDMRACATSAMREASNGKEVQQMIKKETGVSIDIIDGNEEANIIFSSFLKIDYDLNKAVIVIDVGGGSTEISIFEEGEKRKYKSFKVGTIRLLKGKVDDEIWTKIDNWLAKNIESDKDYTVFGTGGNINKMHKLMGKKGLEPVLVKELKELHKELQNYSYSKRITKFQLKPDRADVIIPAGQIFIKILKNLNCNQLIVPKIGLSDGMIHQLHSKHKKK